MTFGGFMYRWRWVVLTAWVAGGAAKVLFVPKVDPTANEAESFLPADSPSRQAASPSTSTFRRPAG